MKPIDPTSAEHRQDLERVLRILENTAPIDRALSVPREEFQARAGNVNRALERHGHKVGIVFSDEHYCGDVPYLGGNINVSIEQVAGVVGPGGFHIVAGLEGGYVAEQLAERAGATVHKVEMLQLADEKYPIAAERLEDVITAAAGGPVDRVALLTPRQVIPAGVVAYLEKLFGREGVLDAQELYFRVKYEKSVLEMRLIADAARVGDAMLRSINGHVAANLDNGAVEGVDLWFEINRAMAVIQKQGLPSGQSSGRTTFDSFKASADLAGGVATTKDLNIVSRNLRITGQGTSNLATEAVSYQIQATVLKKAAPGPVASGNVLAQIPVNVSGTMSSPKVTPDLEGLAKARMQQELDKHKGELQQKLQDQLKGLFSK